MSTVSILHGKELPMLTVKEAGRIICPDVIDKRILLTLVRTQSRIVQAEAIL
jgi:hypothetical protein